MHPTIIPRRVAGVILKTIEREREQTTRLKLLIEKDGDEIEEFKKE